MSCPGPPFRAPAQRRGTLARICAIASKVLPDLHRPLAGAGAPRAMHSLRSWDFDPIWRRIGKTPGKLVGFRIPRVWPGGCSTVSPNSDGALIPSAPNLGEETHHGKALGSASGHRVISDARAGHRVGHVRVHA